MKARAIRHPGEMSSRRQRWPNIATRNVVLWGPCSLGICLVSALSGTEEKWNKRGVGNCCLLRICTGLLEAARWQNPSSLPRSGRLIRAINLVAADELFDDKAARKAARNQVECVAGSNQEASSLVFIHTFPTVRSKDEHQFSRILRSVRRGAVVGPSGMTK